MYMYDNIYGVTHMHFFDDWSSIFFSISKFLWYPIFRIFWHPKFWNLHRRTNHIVVHLGTIYDGCHTSMMESQEISLYNII